MRHEVLAPVLAVTGAAFAEPPEFVFNDVTPSCGVQPYVMAAGMGGGLVAADFDDDGDIDVFVPCGAGVPDQLYRNLGGGQFEEIAGDAGLAALDASRAALWVDLDADHVLDLVVAGDCWDAGPGCDDLTTLRLYRQTADAVFTEVTSTALTGLEGRIAVHRGGLCAGDYDLDGDLDLVVGMWGGEGRVLRNLGGVFDDVTSDVGITTENARDYWQPVMHDFDRDGRPDVFVAVDFTANHLWLGQPDDTFLDGAVAAGVDVAWNDMGVALGDYDNDGDLDIYVTEIFRFGRHNLLLRNDTAGGPPLFTEVSEAAGVDDTGWAWGTVFFDADNDGDLDLAATNGFDEAEWDPDASRFYVNTGGDPVYDDVSSVVGFDDMFWGSGLIAFDYDRDGDRDLMQTCSGGPLRMLENVRSGAAAAHAHLVVRPRMPGANHRAIGAVVRVFAGGVTRMRLVSAGTSFLGQEPAEASFGLGGAAVVDELVVEWPDGQRTGRIGVDVNQVVEIQPQPGDLDGSGTVAFADLLLVIGRWGPCTGLCVADLNGDGSVGFADVLVLLSAWTV
ncbi:MAG: FG-GAP-like repeat-containing protein [Planctomycetota bacterium]|jgi:hypothetical protein